MADENEVTVSGSKKEEAAATRARLLKAKKAQLATLREEWETAKKARAEAEASCRVKGLDVQKLQAEIADLA